VQQKVEIGTRHDTTRHSLMTQITEEGDQWGMANVELHFGGTNLRNSASYMLDQYSKLTGNCIWRKFSSK